MTEFAGCNVWHLLSGTESHLNAVFVNVKDVCFHLSTFESNFFTVEVQVLMHMDMYMEYFYCDPKHCGRHQKCHFQSRRFIESILSLLLYLVFFLNRSFSTY